MLLVYFSCKFDIFQNNIILQDGRGRSIKGDSASPLPSPAINTHIFIFIYLFGGQGQTFVFISATSYGQFK